MTKKTLKKIFFKCNIFNTITYIIIKNGKRGRSQIYLLKKFFKSCNIFKVATYNIIKNGKKDVPKYTF